MGNDKDMEREYNEEKEAKIVSGIYYLLLRGYFLVPDGDEFLGIYADRDKLLQAYMKENEQLKVLQEEGKYSSYCLQIYIFDEANYGQEDGIKSMKPEELWVK